MLMAEAVNQRAFRAQRTSSAAPSMRSMRGECSPKASTVGWSAGLGRSWKRAAVTETKPWLSRLFMLERFPGPSLMPRSFRAQLMLSASSVPLLFQTVLLSRNH